MDQAEFYLQACALITALILIISRNIDDKGMDSYDNYWGISADGRERGFAGVIYHSNGEIDIWSNILDHNPYWY